MKDAWLQWIRDTELGQLYESLSVRYSLISVDGVDKEEIKREVDALKREIERRTCR